MGLRLENYYPSGILFLLGIFLFLSPLFVNAQLPQASCDIGVKVEPKIITSEKRTNTVSQTRFSYYSDWNDISKTFISDDQYTKLELDPLKSGNILHLQNFGFQLPEGALIEGVQVMIEGKSEGMGFVREKLVSLIGSRKKLFGENQAGKSFHNTPWDRDLEKKWKYGGPDNDWGVFLTSDLVNSPDFGIALQLGNGSGSEEVTAMMDQVTIKIFYREMYTFCDGDCVTFSASQNDNIKSFFWHLPVGFELLSKYEKAEIINVGQGNAPYGQYEICVDLTDYNDVTTTCCRPFILKPCITPSLGDFVWEDKNANGLQDVGEPGLEGVEINLFTTEGAFVSTTITDEGGNYIFEDLIPDDYYVQVFYPEGYLASPYNAQNDPRNSDITEENGVGTSYTFSLVDEDNMDIDIGLVPELIIGDFVWEDLNGNGVQENNEPGIVEVGVSLYDDSGILVEQTVTDTNGIYHFDKLYPGSYELRFDVIEAYMSTFPLVGSDQEKDSDINAEYTTGLLLFSEGEERLDIDAGFYRYASLGDFVWIDGNENGLQDEGEEGFSDISLTLLDSDEAEVGAAVTDNDGKYLFENLIPGNYLVRIELPFGYESTVAFAGDDIGLDSDLESIDGMFRAGPVTLLSNEDNSDIDLGVYPLPGKISGTVWYDGNVNGILDEETYRQGITVFLLEDGELVDEVLSDENGDYLFDEIPLGTYTVQFGNPSEDFFTLQYEGQEETDSDVNAEGLTSPIAITPGLEVIGINAGYIIPAALGDYVWFDEDRDGIQDNEENGIEGVTVQLIEEGEVIETVVSDATGIYLFNRVFPGSYSIVFEVNYLIPTIVDGNDIMNDSDVSEIEGEFIIENIEALFGKEDISWDAGFMRPGGDIKGIVWMDDNQDGIRQDGEPGFSDITVILKDDNDAIIAESTTDQDGNYAFLGVEIGNYYLMFESPETYIFTLANQGDDTRDSDVDGNNGQGTTSVFTLGIGDILLFDAGLLEAQDISGTVWKDVNGDGIRDTGDEPLQGITVILKNNQGEELASTVTTIDSEGFASYVFTNQPAGEYYVEFDIPNYFTPTTPHTGNEESDSDISGSFSKFSTDLFIIPGTETSAIDAGVVEFGFVNGQVWKDENGNGIRNEDDDLLSGVGVTLYDDEGNEIASAITNSDGYYEFLDVLAGLYYVQFDLEEEGEATIANVGIDDSVDSDVTNENGNLTTSTFGVSYEGIMNLDLGIIGVGYINGLVWRDANGNGIRENDEILLGNIVVSLFDEANNQVQTTTTSDAGNYSFENVQEGNYYVKFEINSAEEATIPNVGNDDTIDSDVNNENGPFTTSVFTLTTEGINNIDLGLIELGNIDGLVWNDVNCNGVREDGEPSISGVPVILFNLDGEQVQETTTTDGQYLFENVLAGEYYVAFNVDDGYVITDPDAGPDDVDSDVTDANGPYTTSTFALTSIGMSDLDLGLIIVRDITGVLFKDINGNGIREDSDEPLPNVGVNLYTINGALVSSTITVLNNNGNASYFFNEVKQGEYYVEFDVSDDLAFSPANQGGDDTVDSDITAQYSKFSTSTINIPEDPTDHIDGGIIELGNITGIVWFDDNRNGIREDGEGGVADVIVTLFRPDGTEIIGAITNQEGQFEINAVIVGTYYLQYNVSDGRIATIANAGMDDDIDSDVTEENGPFTTPLFDLSQQGIQLNLGLVDPAGISGIVWNDMDANGIREAGENGIGGIEVILFSDTGDEVSRTTTNNDGSYNFDEVTNGDYYIIFGVPQDSQVSPADQGNDDTIDSDVTEENGSGSTSIFTFSGEPIENIDIGLIESTFSLSGLVWMDADGSGMREQDENGVNGVVVILFSDSGTEVASTTTLQTEGVNGIYSFENILPGDYYVGFEIEEGFESTIPNNGNDDTVDSDVTGANGDLTTDLISVTDSDITNIDLGIVVYGDITGRIFVDNNGNGIRESGEPGRNGIFVILYDAEGVEIKRTATSIINGVSGAYRFSSNLAGDYYVQFEPMNGLVATMANIGNDDTIDSDVTGSNGPFTTDIFTLTRTGISNLDFGMIEANTITGRVWFDANCNGYRENEEPGRNNIDVVLYNEDEEIVAETSTASINGFDGSYIFEGVQPGAYFIEFQVAQINEATIANAGNDEFRDSDVTGAFGLFTTDLFNVPEDNLMNIDLGILEPTDVTGYIWEDINENGLRDENESGVGGVEVLLFDENGSQVDRTETRFDDLGFYRFTSVNIGNYYIQFNVDLSYGVSDANVGDDVTIDSDLTDANGINTTDVFKVPGPGITNIGAGIIPLSRIAGRAWLDMDSDGILDNNELGVQDVTVTLYQENGTEVTSTLTKTINGVPGSYVFVNMSAGAYYIEFSGYEGLFPTLADQGNDDSVDSDVTESNGPGTTDVFVIPGDGEQNIHLGLVERGNIAGRVWADNNENGIRDSGEPGRNNVVVILFNESKQEVDRTMTAIIGGQAGSYVFEGIAVGNYYIMFELTEGLTSTIANVGNDDTVDSDVTSGNGPFTTNTFELTTDDISNLDLGIIESEGGTISGIVWDDGDGDGNRENGEEEGAGLEVILRTSTGQIFATTTTANNGFYEFTDLPNGDYFVEFTLPSDPSAATVPFAGNPEIDSDVANENGPLTTRVLSVIIGNSFSNIDFGYYFYISIGDQVWNDANANGVNDNGESGVENISVELYKEPAIFQKITTTDANGNYNLDQLAPGRYYLKFSLPEDAGFTIADNTGNSDDSDVTQANGEGTTDFFELFSGESVNNLDAGIIYGDASLGDFVWIDRNGDGIQSSGEPGINGLLISLYTADGFFVNNTMSTTSDEGIAGFYQFAGIDPGDYYITVSLPDSLRFTDPDQTNDAFDSDITGSVTEGSSDIFTLDIGEKEDLDIGVFVPGEIGDFVWEDINENGVQDPGEPGVKDVEVILLDNNGDEVASTFTDLFGNYNLSGIKPGNYTLFFLLPSADFAFTAKDEGMNDDLDSDPDETGSTDIFSIGNSESNYSLDAGIYNANPRVAGIVWIDGNGDGIRNENTRVEGLQVILLDENDNLVKTTGTDAQGRYAFVDVEPGNYYVEMIIEDPQFTFTGPGQGINALADSDIQEDGKSEMFKIKIELQPTIIDAGLISIEDQQEKVAEESWSYSQAGVKVFPTITRSNINIEFSDKVEGEVTIQIFDRSGQLVHVERLINSQRQGLDLHQLRDGQYYIKAITNVGVATTTFMIMH